MNRKPLAKPLSDLFRPENGRTYKEFWENIASTKEGAYLGVAGVMFDKALDDEDMSIHGEPTAHIIQSKLQTTKDHRVLEIGVGVGRIAEHYAPFCGQFVGGDISANMVKVAEERLKHLDNVELCTLPNYLSVFPDASFDRVYSQIVLIHLDREDVYEYIEESYRVLKPGGRAYFQTNNLLHPSGYREFVGSAHLAREHGQANRGRVHFLTAPELRQYVTGVGFEIDEGLSHLEVNEQKFDFVIPDLQWEHFLIAVVNKPL